MLNGCDQILSVSDQIVIHYNENFSLLYHRNYQTVRHVAYSVETTDVLVQDSLEPEINIS